jgi:hypothetical protein
MTEADKKILSDLLAIIKAAPGLISKEVSDKVFKLSISNINLQLASNRVDMSSFESGNVAAAAIMASGASEDEKNAQLKELKEKMQTVLEQAIKNVNLTDTGPQVFGDSYMSTQISATDDASIVASEQYALENRLAIINTTDCINKLRAYYNTTSIIMVKTDFDRSFNPFANSSTSQTVNIDFYDSYERIKLNKSICSDFDIKLPLPESADLNITEYNEVIKSRGIDIYNPDDPAFTSRCITDEDPSTSYDTTVNSRIKSLYKNKTMLCTSGCKYINIDSNNYVNCQCKGVTKTDIDFLNNIGDWFLDGLSNININVVTCYHKVFSKSINRNAGLYTSMALIFFASIGGLVLYRIHKETNLEEVKRTDCQYYDKAIMRPKEYFLAQVDGVKKVGGDELNSSRHLKEKEDPELNRQTTNDVLARRSTGHTRRPTLELMVLNNNLAGKQNEETIDNNEHGDNEITIHPKQTGVKQTENIETVKPQEAKPHKITLRDYLSLEPKDIPMYDQRTASTFIKDEVYTKHRILSVLFKQSYMDPVIIRSTKLVFHMATCMVSSALCFTDKDIEERSTSAYKFNFFYIFFEFKKLMVTLLLTSVIYLLVCLIVMVPNSHRQALNEELKSNDENRIKQGA